MNISAFDYHLPEERIAQYPVEPRDASRLMVVDRKTGRFDHRRFYDLPEYLTPEDALVVNRTRVMPARLLGERSQTGGRVEVVLIREREPGLWECLMRPAGRLGRGTGLSLEGGALEAVVVNSPGEEPRLIRFLEDVNLHETLMKVGRIPLPPYIRRDADGEDRARYQTVYAEETGAVAAPTAGLHFTEGLLERIRQKGVAVLPTLLHVGPGTFQPLRTEIVEAHVMEAEYYRVEADTTRKIVETRGKGRRVVAVGTTVTRALETMAGEGMEKGTLAVRDYEGWTTCYIYPPYRFQLVDALLTNFHLPRSTLLMLVCAFGGHDLILRAYEEAVRAQYRFYSYGDAMLVI